MNSLKTIAILSLLTLIAVPGAWAGEGDEMAAAPYRVIVHTDHVIPGQMEAYEEKSKAWAEAFKSTELGKEWNWFTSAHNDFTYVTIFPFSMFAELDKDDERNAQMKEAIGEESLKELNAPSNSVASHYSEIAKLRPELGYRPANSEVGEDATFLRIGVHTVIPGMNKQFEDLMKNVAEAFGKAEHPLGFNVWEIEFGRGSYVVTVMANDAKHFYSQPSTGAILNKAVGEEETAAMYAEWRNCIADYETSDATMRPDLSYDAAANQAE